MQTEVTVLDAQGDEMTKVSSGADGRFAVTLDPGTYTLVAVLPSGGPPSAAPVTVTVVAHAFVLPRAVDPAEVVAEAEIAELRLFDESEASALPLAPLSHVLLPLVWRGTASA